MSGRLWSEIVNEIVGTGLTHQQITLLLELVSAMSCGMSAMSADMSANSPLWNADSADLQREKWRIQKQKQRQRTKVMSADMSAGQADNAPLSLSSSEVVFEERGLQGKKEQQPELLEGQEKPKRKVSRGTRLPDDWTPSEKDVAFAEQYLGAAEIEVEALKFRNYWTNRTDRVGSKPRWDRAWQNWILNVRGQSNGQRGPRAFQDDRLSVSSAIDRRLIQAENGELRFPPRPSLLPAEREDDRRLLPARRSA